MSSPRAGVAGRRRKHQEAEVDSNPWPGAEAGTVAERRPAADNIDSRQGSSGSLHKQRKDLRQVGWHSTEHIGQNSPLEKQRLRLRLRFPEPEPESRASQSMASCSYCCGVSSCYHGLGPFHIRRTSCDWHQLHIHQCTIPVSEAEDSP